MSMLTGKVDVPGVGDVDKRVLFGVGGLGAAFLGWKWWQARSADAYDPAAEGVDPGMEDPGVLPSVAGAVREDGAYGLPDGSGGSSADSYGFRGTTNDQWTQYAANQLSQGSESWSYSAIVSALGKFVTNKALTGADQTIVQAAIAVAGYPPEGSHVIIPGGDVKVTVAPTGLKVTSTSSTAVSLSWGAVSGATSYDVFRSGAAANAVRSNSPAATIAGLQPNTEYTFQVAAVSTGGETGPKSSAVKGKTQAVKLAAPTGVKSSSVTATAATVSWSKVSGATAYRVYFNGQLRGTADGGSSSVRVTGLAKKTRYSVTVRADTTNQEPGPASKAISVTTKSK